MRNGERASRRMSAALRFLEEGAALEEGGAGGAWWWCLLSWDFLGGPGLTAVAMDCVMTVAGLVGMGATAIC
jgi:hypothetical protein